MALGEPMFLVFGMLLFVALNEPALRCLNRYYAPGEAEAVKAHKPSMAARLAAVQVRVPSPLASLAEARELAKAERAEIERAERQAAEAAAAQREAEKAAELDRLAEAAAAQVAEELEPAEKARSWSPRPSPRARGGSLLQGP